ncbi:hypothetical protein T484DRAFT_1911160, partial [Baffinella frigidus]
MGDATVVGEARDEALRATLRTLPPDLSSFLATLRGAPPVGPLRLALLLDACGSYAELHRLCAYAGAFDAADVCRGLKALGRAVCASEFMGVDEELLGAILLERAGEVVGELGTVHMSQILSVLGELDVVPREGVQNAILERAQQLVGAFTPHEAVAVAQTVAAWNVVAGRLLLRSLEERCMALPTSMGGDVHMRDAAVGLGDGPTPVMPTAPAPVAPTAPVPPAPTPPAPVLGGSLWGAAVAAGGSAVVHRPFSQLQTPSVAWTPGVGVSQWGGVAGGVAAVVHRPFSQLQPPGFAWAPGVGMLPPPAPGVGVSQRGAAVVGVAPASSPPSAPAVAHRPFSQLQNPGVAWAPGVGVSQGADVLAGVDPPLVHRPFSQLQTPGFAWGGMPCKTAEKVCVEPLKTENGFERKVGGNTDNSLPCTLPTCGSLDVCGFTHAHKTGLREHPSQDMSRVELESGGEAG